jgi:hypothetical protein
MMLDTPVAPAVDFPLMRCQWHRGLCLASQPAGFLDGRQRTLEVLNHSAGVPTMTRSLSRIRSEAFRRQAGRCFYCSVLMWTDDYVAFAKRHGMSPRAARRL